MAKQLTDDEVITYLYKYAYIINEFTIDIHNELNKLKEIIDAHIISKEKLLSKYDRLQRMLKRAGRDICIFYEWKAMVDFMSEVSPETISQREYIFFEGMPATISQWCLGVDNYVETIERMIETY